MMLRQLRANRTSAIVMATLILVLTTSQVQSYQSAFPDARTRSALLSGLAGNGALRALYGYPHDITNATGWLAWRGMSTAVVIMSIWAAFITIGALRGEEEAGRAELTLSQPQQRRTWLVAVLAAVTLESLAIGLLTLLGLLAVGVTQGLMTSGDCVKISLQLVAPALLFASIGGVAAQLIDTARGARVAAGGVVALAFFARTAADTGSGIAWLRWATPLGWFEEIHPPATPAPGALLAIGGGAIVLGLLALRLLASRDIGTGILPRRDRRPARLVLLGSPWQAALRDQTLQVSIWVVGVLSLSLLLGALTKTVLEFFRSNSTFSGLLGSDFQLTSYMAAAFSPVQLIVVLLTATLLVGARGDEASGRLELLMAGPLSRIAWLLSHALLAGALALGLALDAAFGFWGSATLASQHVSLSSSLEAALNCVPLIVLAAGATAAALALTPRAIAFVYAPIAIAYLWEAIGSALKAPRWMLDISPFHALAAVPREDFALLPAIIVTGVGAVLMVVATATFRGRDLVTG